MLKVVFCRIVIELSNASFNHVSTSFGEDNSTTFSLEEKKRSFITYSELIFETAKINPEATTCIYQHDSTILEESIASKYDTVITSPPYPNRISYIRELRPYMYWLDYLKAADDASDLDWNTIGGTWGAATSKLSGWTKQTNLIPGYILEIADAISAAENKSSRLMANYVRKYFDDMALHFQTVFLGIRAGGTVHYIVGNSNFYGNTVPSERAFVDMLTEIGFKNAKAKVVRKRNCNKALFEYWVSANKE